ncbi:hypothetical protein Tco_0916593, partial [Tanacetum coccineum]
YLENQIVWESNQEDLKIPGKEALIFYGPQRNPNEPPRYLYIKDLFYLKNRNTEEKRYVLSLHKIHATPFPESDLEAKLTRQERANTKEVNSNHKTVEVIRITTEKKHGLDFMDETVVKRDDNKFYGFYEAVFKYLNMDDIEDMYYMCLNNKVNYRENRILNSFLTFIRSYVIWERVHDYQLGLESYQIKVNLTAPTLIIPGIEKCDL